MGLPTPKLGITGLLQAKHVIGIRPLHTMTFQGKAKAVWQQALVWRSEGKHVWIEVATIVESAINPDFDIFGTRATPEELGKETAERGRSAGENPYLSEVMARRWYASWRQGMLDRGELP